jgi:hypothetical protein
MALSSQEFEKLKARLNEQKGLTSTTSASVASVNPPSMGGGFLSGVKSSFQDRNQNVIEARQKVDTGKQSLASGFLQSSGQVAGMVGDVGGEALKSVGEITGVTENVIKPVGTAILNTTAGKKGLEAIQAGLESYSAFKEKNPEVAGDLEAVLNITSLIPAMKGTQIAGKGVLKAGATVAGQTLETGGKVLSKSGVTTSKTGSAIFKSAITPNVKEAEQILTYKAKAPFTQRLKSAITGSPIYDESGKIVSAPITRADTGLEKGLFGTQTQIGVQSRRANQKLYNNTIAPALKVSKDVVTKDELFNPIIDRINSTVEPGRKKALEDAFDAIKDEYKDVDNYTLEVAQKVKQGLDEFTPEKVFRGKSIANEYRTLQNDMANAIRKKTYDSLKDQNIKKAYIDWGNLKELEKIGIKAITEQGSKGGFGSFWTSAWDMATVPVRTVGGQVLYRVGNKIEFVGDKGVKSLGQYLKSKGFVKPKN